jgi:hypothetical protein
MKKIAIIFMMLITISLSSCGDKAERQIIRDEPATEIKEALNLSLVEQGKNLNKDLDHNLAYTNVQIAEETKSSLFYQTIDLDEYMTERFKQINLNVLFFNGNFPSSDADSFIQEMNHADYGLSKEKIGYDFKITENISNTLFGKLALSTVLTLPADYVKKENDAAKLVVMYLPTYCTYNDGTQDWTKVFLFVPVYYAFAYESTVATYTEDVKQYKIELDDKGLLPSKNNEKL